MSGGENVVFFHVFKIKTEDKCLNAHYGKNRREFLKAFVDSHLTFPPLAHSAGILSESPEQQQHVEDGDNDGSDGEGADLKNIGEDPDNAKDGKPNMCRLFNEGAEYEDEEEELGHLVVYEPAKLS